MWMMNFKIKKKGGVTIEKKRMSSFTALCALFIKNFLSRTVQDSITLM